VRGRKRDLPKVRTIIASRARGVQTGTIYTISNPLLHQHPRHRLKPPCLKPMSPTLDACKSSRTCTYLTFCSLATASRPSEFKPTNVDHSTASNSLNSPLLRLPAELRNKIYSYIFQYAHLPKRHPKGAIAFALHTCQQLFHETSALLIVAFGQYDICSLLSLNVPLYDLSQETCEQIKNIMLSEQTVSTIVAPRYRTARCGDLQHLVGYMLGLERVYVRVNRQDWRCTQVEVEKGCRDFFQRPGLEVQVLYRGEED
jgi:hypothetical protein